MPVPLATPVQAALAVAVIWMLTALTAAAVSRTLSTTPAQDGDGVFWYGFTGGFGCLCAIAGAMVLIPEATAVVGLAGVLGIGMASGWVWRGEQERVSRRRRLQLEAARSAVRARHESILQRWVSYELDPAVAIDYPDMTDVRRPETARLVRAMRTAAVLREQVDGDDDGAAADYGLAVGELESAFEAAERAAGAHSTERREGR
ncbi:hypothetical protein GC088_00610 [Arthrobacter sp. JZ12]|uniref:hypothetical protein n=1 Tax=Arthrobacter sp. JZ12 TaxID=2654190 RepID=UPI002B4A2DC6|nr:hypothetical protein [Arthrobacter sp. JZ12]WRH23771.1 hypothetical protein GC088_00610 [Arthrobacter sp. JZ12]